MKFVTNNLSHATLHYILATKKSI